MTQRLFVALSTGQNIANLLPILELADADDRVMWLESATARDRGWSDGALGVLRARGLDDVDRVRLADDEPATLYQILSAHPGLARARDRDRAGQIHLIANGGTKLQLAAALRALEDRAPLTLYNAYTPCRLEQVPPDPRQPLVSSHYRRHDLDLPEVLGCQGRTLAADSGGRVWPRQEDRLADTSYGIDPAYTRQRHDAIWAWYGNRAPERAADADALLDQPPGFQQAARLAPDQLTRFGNTVRNVHDPDKQLEQVYHSALKLAKLAASARRRPHAEAPRPFGEEFEYAVLGRLLQWLDTSAPAQAVVQSVWRDVKATRGDGAQNVAQLDIAIALRNGILLSLECKSYDIDLKDIDARIAVLQRSASSLAAMAVCSPWLTGLRDRPWFPRMQKYALQMQAWPQIAHLPLTLAGQPAGYTDPDGNTHQVPAFEDALQRWLARYL